MLIHFCAFGILVALIFDDELLGSLYKVFGSANKSVLRRPIELGLQPGPLNRKARCESQAAPV